MIAEIVDTKRLGRGGPRKLKRCYRATDVAKCREISARQLEKADDLATVIYAGCLAVHVCRQQRVDVREDRGRKGWTARNRYCGLTDHAGRVGGGIACRGRARWVD